MYTHKRALLGYECLDDQIRQKHIISEADRVQNSRVSKDNHKNGKGGIEQAFTSRNKSLD